MAWDQKKTCDLTIHTPENNVYYTTISKWRDQMALSTKVGNKITVFPEAVAPFLYHLANGKAFQMKPSCEGVTVSGSGQYKHGIMADIYPITATQHDNAKLLFNCEPIVAIVLRPSVSGEGAFKVYGSHNGMDCAVYLESQENEGGLTHMEFMTNVERGCYEDNNGIIIHVTDYATTKAAIEANLVTV